jgi:hypothetical protein
VAGTVQDAEDDDRVGTNDEEDAVGEPFGRRAANFRRSPKQRTLTRVRSGRLNDGFGLSDKLFAQPGSLALIPDRGVRDVGLR